MVYEIMGDSIQIDYKDRKKIEGGCTLEKASADPVVMETFESPEEALEALKKYKTKIREYSRCWGGTFFEVTEYYIQESEYDEEGDWIGGGNIGEYSKYEIAVVAKPSCEIIGIFDNYEDAERAYYDYLDEDDYDDRDADISFL